MRIAGIQKLTLLDYPGKVACTVFLSGCNLRCPYCHNPGLVLPERGNESEMPVAEVEAFLARRKGTLDGVCVTGGELTLQPELPAFLEKLRCLGFAIKLDTNGTNPEMLKALMHDGILDYVAMDIKNSPERYRETCGGADVLSKVQESAGLLLNGAQPGLNSERRSASRCIRRGTWRRSGAGSKAQNAIFFRRSWIPAIWCPAACRRIRAMN